MAAEISDRTRPVFETADELFEGATRLGDLRPDDARSAASFERWLVDGEPCVAKYVHVDHDFAMRAAGDIGCIPAQAWATGLMDLAPEHVDHATLGVARWGRNGWGAVLLMRDVSSELVPIGDEPVDEPTHLGFLDDLAAFSARGWGRDAPPGLLAPAARWQFFGPDALATEARLGFGERVPQIALDGWQRFTERVPAGLAASIDELRRDPAPLVIALTATPWTLLHGDWKFGNLGRTGDRRRTVLIDWAYVGAGPVAHELGWYLALNRSRLPVGHSKESTIAAFEASLQREGIELGRWWEPQLGLALLGSLIQFGWEKAFGPDDELAWWCDRAAEGLRWM